MAIENYPSYGTPEEIALWHQRHASATQQLSNGGIGGGGSGEVEVDQDNGRITDSEDNLLGYLHRYLHLRITSDAEGTTLVPDISAFTPDTIYVGTFNSPSTNTPSNTANFTYTPFSWSSGSSMLYYTNIGGRNVRFTVADDSPGGGALEITMNELFIDLETGASAGPQGERGLPGTDALVVRIDSSIGNAFRNDSGSSTLTANLESGGVEASANIHNQLGYRWTFAGQTICVDNSRNVLNTTAGQPLTSTDGMVCSTGVPADSAVSTGLGTALRSINIGAEDVNSRAHIVCNLSNIPDDLSS